MGGHAQSKHNLGCNEGAQGKHDRALKQFMISANMGHNPSVEAIKMMCMGGLATKEQYADALRGYQDAVQEMKNHDRDEAKTLENERIIRWE